jgi:hypothetical protein
VTTQSLDRPELRLTSALIGRRGSKMATGSSFGPDIGLELPGQVILQHLV